MRLNLLAGLLASTVVSFSPANAAITLNIVQSGPNVVATTSGSFDATGLGVQGSGGPIPNIEGSIALFVTGLANVQFYSGLIGPSEFGTGTSFISPTSNSGDTLYLWGAGFGTGGWVGLPTDYVFGSALSATTTFANQTIGSLDLTAGTYVYAAPNDTITVNIGDVPAVPEPATWAMMLLGFGAIGISVTMQRRRLQAA